MERLTYKKGEHYYTKDDCIVKVQSVSDNGHLDVLFNCLDKLGQLEDAEEQGLLLRLPCREFFESSGDTVYYIFDYEVVECINCGVSMDYEGRLWIALACDEHIFPYRNPDPEHDLDPTDWCINTTQVPLMNGVKQYF